MTFQRNFRFIRRLNMILESESLHMKSTNTTNTKDLTGSYPSVQEDKVSLELTKFRGRKKTLLLSRAKKVFEKSVNNPNYPQETAAEISRS